MSPQLVLLIWLFLLLGLLYFDPAKKIGTSPTLWVPVIWFFFVGTRMPSQWVGSQVATAAAAFEDANPLNEAVFLTLMLAAIGILIVRSFKWGEFVRRNSFLMAFLVFAAMSCLWSDFPIITMKRWYRDLGAYFSMLVALSDSQPLEGVRTVLRRFGYLTIPLSVVLVKYYPQTGMYYDVWTGASVAVGVTTSKNELGVVCLIAGIFLFWDTITRWPDRAEGRTKRILFVNSVLAVMTAWLVYHAHCATANVCLAIGSLVIVAAATKVGKRHSSWLKVLIPSCFVSYVVLAYWFDINASLVGIVGRNPTLTDRTHIWATLLGMGTNPVLGTGYRSFFLGARLQQFWRTFPGINEAHNGYLDLYLNLGIVGLVLFLAFLMASYHTICERIKTAPALASLGLAIWTILLFYNVTEAAFDGGLLWLSLMLIGVWLAAIDQEGLSQVAPMENVVAGGRFSRVPSGAPVYGDQCKFKWRKSLAKDEVVSTRNLPGLSSFRRENTPE